jgi:hypothetical protein
MATRALIGYLDTDGDIKLTTTYNHYDGYPSNLGKALENFFNSDTLAKDLANYGYVSYIDPKTGDIEANNKQAPGKVKLSTNFLDAMDEIAEEIDSYGGDYGYIWDNSKGEWITIENEGIGEMSQDLEMQLAHLKDKFGAEEVDEAYHVGDDKEVVTKEAEDKVDSQEPFAKVLSQAMFKLQDQPKDMIDAYKKSLANDVRLNGVEQYADYTVEDFEEDYNNYIQDKMDIDESFIRQMKYKAGIIK